MSPATALRQTNAAWFLPALFAGSCLSVVGQVERTGSAVERIASSGNALYLAGPILAAFIALGFRRFPRWLRPLRGARSGVPVVFSAWWPLLVGGPVTFCLAVLASARALPIDPASRWLLLIDFASALAAGLVGLAAGWAVPAVLAVPTVATGLFVWFAYTPAGDNLFMHNLNSNFICCARGQQPAGYAVQATLLLLGVVCLSVTALLGPTGWARRSPVLIAVALLACLAGGYVAGVSALRASGRELGYLAVESRPMRCHEASGASICLFPENSDRARFLSARMRDLNARLELLGLVPITRLTEGSEGGGAIWVRADEEVSDSALLRAVAVGYVARRTACTDAPRPELARLNAAIAALAGAPAVPHARQADRLATAWVEKSLVNPVAAGAWFEQRVEDLRCSR